MLAKTRTSIVSRGQPRATAKSTNLIWTSSVGRAAVGVKPFRPHEKYIRLSGLIKMMTMIMDDDGVLISGDIVDK